MHTRFWIYAAAIVAVGIIILPTIAQEWGDFNPCIAQRPPAQFNHEPIKPYTVERVTRPVLHARCRFYYEPGKLLGCADVETNSIYVVNNLPNSGWYQCVISHEKAHLNGWPHDHPTAFALRR